MSGPRTGALPVEEFLQSMTAQLDRAQDLLAVKVRGTGRPLTWALKDLTIDLKVFVEVDPTGRVMLRTAGPNQEGASSLHLSFTTITRPMVEENTTSFREETDARTLGDLRTASDLDDEDARRLDWVGVRTVGQLKRLTNEADPKQLEAMIGIPANRLRAALEAAGRPAVTGHRVETGRDGQTYLRIQGANLYGGFETEVRLAGEPVEVVESNEREVVVRPGRQHSEGQIEVLVQGQRATGWYRIPGASDRSASDAKAPGTQARRSDVRPPDAPVDATERDR